MGSWVGSWVLQGAGCGGPQESWVPDLACGVLGGILGAGPWVGTPVRAPGFEVPGSGCPPSPVTPVSLHSRFSSSVAGSGASWAESGAFGPESTSTSAPGAPFAWAEPIKRPLVATGGHVTVATGHELGSSLLPGGCAGKLRHTGKGVAGAGGLLSPRCSCATPVSPPWESGVWP